MHEKIRKSFLNELVHYCPKFYVYYFRKDRTNKYINFN